MRLTLRDGLATLFVCSAGAVYGIWASRTAMTGLSTRDIAAVVFGLGWAACLADKNEMAVVYGAARGRPRPPVAYAVLASAVGALALLTGITALVNASGTMLALLVTFMCGMWMLATARHLLARSTYSAVSSAARPPKAA